MTPKGGVILWTIVTWLPILSFFYLPNTFWGSAIKVFAAFCLASFCYGLTLGPGGDSLGSAGAGFILNGIWFTIINLQPLQWVSLILWFLIVTGLGTCYKILQRIDKSKLSTE